MLEIDSGERVIRIDPGKIEKIVASYNPANLADFYYQNQEKPEYSLTAEESLELMSFAWTSATCMFRTRNRCYWMRQQKASPARCVRCRIALLYKQKSGKDLRDQAKTGPSWGYAVALLAMYGITMYSANSSAEAWRQVKIAKEALKAHALKSPKAIFVSHHRRRAK